MRSIGSTALLIEQLWQDLRYAQRALRRTPGFTLAAIVTLALGIGANVGIFSVINAALLRRLPYPDPERLVLAFERDAFGEGGGLNVLSFANFLDWQSESQSFEAIAVARAPSFNLAAEGSPAERIRGAICSWTLFPVLGVQPVLGRTFRAAEDAPGATPVAIISYGLWQDRFGGAADILRRQIRLNAENYDIVGVMPRGFGYPDRDVAVWVSVQRILSAEDRTKRSSHQLYAVGRLRPGVGREQASAELSAIARRIREAHPGEATGRSAAVLGLADASTTRNEAALLVLLGVAGCVLLVACVNVANLLLARSAQRRRELAVRSALGAGTLRVVRQLLTESTVLSLMGAVAGLALASGLAAYLARQAPILLGPSDIDTSAPIEVNLSVLLFATALAVVTGLCSGILPAWQVARADLTEHLKDGGRSGTSGRAHRRFRTGLVSAEVALSLVLLVAAGLLLRSFAELRNVPVGLRSDRVLTVGVSLPEVRYETREQVAGFVRQVQERLNAVPGVRAAALISCLPLAGYCGDRAFQVEGRPLPPGQFNLALGRAASPDYFSTMGIPLHRGRAFTPQDGRWLGGQRPRDNVVVISESMARRFWPQGEALGQYITMDDEPSARYQIAGIVGDVPIRLDEAPLPTMYFPLLEGDRTTFHAVLSTDPDPAALVPAVRREMSRLDADVPPFAVRTLDEMMGQSAAQRRFMAALVGLFAVVALALASVGLYGVLSYAVAQRRTEIGIRIALGAMPSQVHWLVLMEGLRPALVGTLAGMAGAAMAAHLLRSLLFGVKPLDPLTFALVPIVLLLVAWLACSLPAWRATRADPLAALR